MIQTDGISDNTMIGPGAHEDAVTNELADNDVEKAKAKVLALLVLASAVNRLAEAQEANADR